MSGVFPEIVWTAAILRAVDARARAELQLVGQTRVYEAGAAIFRAGDAADSVYVVASGAVDVFVGGASRAAVKRAADGDAFGEDATLDVGSARRWDAVAVSRSEVVSIPVLMLRRALGRAGSAGGVADRIERTLRRAATADLLAASPLAEGLPPKDRDLLVDATVHVDLARGESLFARGDAPRNVYLVADGLLEARDEDDAVVAIFAAGDVVADALPGAPHTIAVRASGPTRALAVRSDAFAEVAARHAVLTPRVERAFVEARRRYDAAQSRDRSDADENVFHDLYRLKVARSLLVIDQNACVRCGHCAWSCADAHDDGLARLVRRGDRIVTSLAVFGAPDARESTFLLAQSCQHCTSPACMTDCPTGAITRNERGDVAIREDLCIGCGNCAKGCPWDNIQMAPRPSSSLAQAVARPSKPASAEVAVKCDLCSGLGHGPACVAACPTEAIVRIVPLQSIPEVRAALPVEANAAGVEPVLAARVPATPWLLGALAIAVGVAARTHAVGPAPSRTSGLAAGVCVAIATAYVVVKRRSRLRVRPFFLAHLAAGVGAMGAAFAHAGLRAPPNVAGALSLAFWATSIVGVVSAVAYRVVPACLTRIERGGALPEDLDARARELDEQTYARLSGRSDVVKALFARILLPYMRSPMTPLLALARGATQATEATALDAAIARATDGRASPRLEGAGELVRLVVARAAIPLERVLVRALRGAPAVHVVLTALVVVLLLAHVAFELTVRWR